MPRVWVYQDRKQVQKHGEDRAGWYVGFYDPGGKRKCRSCGVVSNGLKAANKLSEKIAAELLTGTYESTTKKTWEECRKEYEAKGMEDMVPASRQCTGIAHDRSPNTSLNDGRKRAEGRTCLSGDDQYELRHLRAAIRKAFRWEAQTGAGNRLLNNRASYQPI